MAVDVRIVCSKKKHHLPSFESKNTVKSRDGYNPGKVSSLRHSIATPVSLSPRLPHPMQRQIHHHRNLIRRPNIRLFRLIGIYATATISQHPLFEGPSNQRSQKKGYLHPASRPYCYLPPDPCKSPPTPRCPEINLFSN